MKLVIKILLGVSAAVFFIVLLALTIVFPSSPASGFTLKSGSSWLNTGNNSWMLTAGTLVGLQSVPGIALYYAGLTRQKHAINTALMVFYAFASVLVIWVLMGYNMGFGTTPLISYKGFDFVGKPGLASSGYFLGSQTLYGPGGSSLLIPNATFMFFQFVFAAITPILAVGGMIERINFKAWMIFVPAFTVLIYSPLAYSMFAGGWLNQLGAVDFSGGYVIHLDAGMAALAGAIVIGPRLIRKGEKHEPHNLMLVLAGAGLIWLGWNGFNGGDPGGATIDAGIAILNTNLAAATSAIAWMIMDYIAFKKPTLIGATTGAITGLVGITPAAGYVNGLGAIAIGIATGTIPWIFLHYIEPRFKVDDSLGVFSSHAVAGVVGGLFTGIFADPAVTQFVYPGLRGLLYGNPNLLFVQAFAAAFVIVYVFAVTFGLFKLISLVVPLRADDVSLHHGDMYLHGEVAYSEGVHIERLDQQ